MAASSQRVAQTLLPTLGLLFRRMRQSRLVAELSPPESSALASLMRSGPTTSAELARAESISAQSMHATIRGLERRGLVARSTDPGDGRRVLLRLTAAGRQKATDKRNARVEQYAAAIEGHFTPEERDLLLAAAPLLERLAKVL